MSNHDITRYSDPEIITYQGSTQALAELGKAAIKKGGNVIIVQGSLNGNDIKTITTEDPTIGWKKRVTAAKSGGIQFDTTDKVLFTMLGSLVVIFLAITAMSVSD